MTSRRNTALATTWCAVGVAMILLGFFVADLRTVLYGVGVCWLPAPKDVL